VQHGVITVTHYKGKIFSPDVKADLYISMVNLFKHHHKILIVDDIADTGICLKETVKAIKKTDPDADDFSTATLHYKPKSIVKPTFYAEEIDNDLWINYPWETHVKSGVAV
jgi:hypoxanthine phosphoribosyltransferase